MRTWCSESIEINCLGFQNLFGRTYIHFKEPMSPAAIYSSFAEWSFLVQWFIVGCFYIRGMVILKKNCKDPVRLYKPLCGNVLFLLRSFVDQKKRRIEKDIMPIVANQQLSRISLQTFEKCFHSYEKILMPWLPPHLIQPRVAPFWNETSLNIIAVVIGAHFCEGAKHCIRIGQSFSGRIGGDLKRKFHMLEIDDLTSFPFSQCGKPWTILFTRTRYIVFARGS